MEASPYLEGPLSAGPCWLHQEGSEDTHSLGGAHHCCLGHSQDSYSRPTAGHLAGTGSPRTLATGGRVPPRSPSLSSASVPPPHLLCTRITASRERMALRLGFCFQPSSERGSTYRKQYISHQSQGPTGPAHSHPRGPGLLATSTLYLGQETLPGLNLEQRLPLRLPRFRPGHSHPVPSHLPALWVVLGEPG